MNYVKYFNLFGVDTKEIPCITGKGAPTAETVGAVGLFYMDTDTGEVYKCIGVSELDGVYAWVPLGDNIKIAQTTGNSDSAVMSQNATTKALSEIEEYIGLPKNLFDVNTFSTTVPANWGISVTDSDVTFTHLREYTSGSPTAPLSLEAGEYAFGVTYEGANDFLYLYKNGTQIKRLAYADTFTIEDGNSYEIRLVWGGSGSVTAKGISIKENSPTIKDELERFSYSLSEVSDAIIAEKNYETVASNRCISATNGNLIGAGNATCFIARINVVPLKLYTISASTLYGCAYWAFFDAQDTLVEVGEKATKSGVSSIENVTLVAPENASYIYIAYSTASVIAKVQTIEVNNPKTKWKDKKWVCVGDSLTDANNATSTKRYFDYVYYDTGINVVNMGVSGSGYARRYDDGNAFYQRAESIDTTADVVTIFGSFNDLSSDLPLGTSSDADTTTIGGCINKTIDVIQSRIPTVVLGVVSPTPWESTKPATSGGAYNYVNLLKEICELRSIPFLDLWRGSNLRPWDEDFRSLAYSKDNGAGTHPDETGHKIIAPKFKAFLETLII